MPGKPGRVMMKPKIMELFQRSPGTTQFVGDLASRFDCTEHQVAECIAGIIRTDSLPGLTVEARARSWVYRPGAKPAKATAAKRVFEEIGPARDGSIIIQDDEGKLYRAQEL